MSPVIVFRPLSLEDCRWLHQWLQYPHVRAFWDDGDRTLEQVTVHYFRKDNVNRYLFSINEEPAGFIQSCWIDATHDYAKFTQQHQNTVGIDFFIGHQDCLGRGYATFVLTEFISSYCQNADCILVDPEPSNEKAIHIYQKYGFTKVAECWVKHKLHWVMVAKLKKATDLS